MNRYNDRAPNELRPTVITPNFTMHAEGSVLIEAGNTRVIEELRRRAGVELAGDGDC